MSSILSRTFTLLLVGAPLLAACDKGPKADPQPVAAAKTATPTETAAVADGTAAAAPAPASAEVTGTKYGAGVTLTESVAIDAILANPDAYKDKTVRTEGMITDVCPKRGCWMDLGGSQPGQKLKFKVTDGEMVFPMDAKGMKAVVQGVVSVRELTLEQTKEHAEYEASETGKKFDPASITKPMTLVKIDGTGAVLTAQK